MMMFDLLTVNIATLTRIEQDDSFKAGKFGTINVHSIHVHTQLGQDPIENANDTSLLGAVSMQREIWTKAHQLRRPSGQPAVQRAIRLGVQVLFVRGAKRIRYSSIPELIEEL